MRLLMLVVPDDHGGMGMDKVGYVMGTGNVFEAVWLIDPNKDTWDTKDDTMFAEAGRHFFGTFPSLEGLALFTRYAVAELDGTLVYQPEGVFRYARKDPELWQI